ncbi:MAG: hypothetical protein Ct9H90mP28_2700 [Paracoccaceae bacterium]|nr:MAG: hypothetical protein Ct9H90mP28_2700 [Paracoccaceae bacterium]
MKISLSNMFWCSKDNNELEKRIVKMEKELKSSLATIELQSEFINKLLKENDALKQDSFINEDLIRENELLMERLNESDNQWAKNIDVFVEKWFEENRDNIDIGVINFGLFKVDIFPDYLEKHIYKKVIKIVYSFIQSAIAPKIV